jgi:hypothetical protein
MVMRHLTSQMDARYRLRDKVAALLQFIYEVQHVPSGASQPVELQDHQRVADGVNIAARLEGIAKPALERITVGWSAAKIRFRPRPATLRYRIDDCQSYQGRRRALEGSKNHPGHVVDPRFREG